MSRAFVKEDAAYPERSGRTKSVSGLPPGAANYITESGERRLRDRLAELRRGSGDSCEEIAHLEQILASVTVIKPPAVRPIGAAFGAALRVRASDGKPRDYRIVGVDEVDFEADAVSWISPIGRSLLGAKVGDRIKIGPGDRGVTLEAIRYEISSPS